MKWPFPDKPPREVQLEALAASTQARLGRGTHGFAYFMRQRLGKTWTAYAEFKNMQEEGLVDWFFLIVPNSLKAQWVTAIEDVDPYTPIRVYDSHNKARTDYYFANNKKGGVFIINYESMKSFMKNEGWTKFDVLRTFLVADESTKIKEHSNSTTKSCLELASICQYTRILTGKPKANSNADLWSQLKFITATQRNYHQHKYTFSLVGGYKGKSIIKDLNTAKLQEEMAPYCYIAPDKYIKGFDKVYEPLRFIELEGKQKELYDQMENELIIEIGNSTKITAPIVLVKYLRLQQISSGIAGDMDGYQHNIVEPRKNPKIKNVLEILETDIPNKVIIACRFKLSIDNLYNVLTKEGYKCAVMKGGMDVEPEKLKFNTTDCDIMLAQIQVLSYGHTLCGTKDNPCDSMIFYENDFSLINRAQAESRPENFDWQNTISYYDAYCSEMEKYILDALIRKEDASLAIMGYSREHGILFNRQNKNGDDGILIGV